MFVVDKTYENMIYNIKAGVSFDKLSKVILTHQDLDHIGGLPGILKEIPHKVDSPTKATNRIFRARRN